MATGLNGLGALALGNSGVPVRLSVCTPYQLASNGIYFREYLYWNLLLNSVEKIKIYLKSEKNNLAFYTKGKCVYIVHRCDKCFVTPKQCK